MKRSDCLVTILGCERMMDMPKSKLAVLDSISLGIEKGKGKMSASRIAGIIEVVVVAAMLATLLLVACRYGTL